MNTDVKIVTAKNVRKLAKDYKAKNKGNMNLYFYVFLMAMYSSRIFGLCITRQTDIYNKIKRDS